MIHCMSVSDACSSDCSTGNATLTAVPSMNVRLDPMMVATRVQRRFAPRAWPPRPLLPCWRRTLLNVTIAETLDQVIVDHANVLHVSVDHRRSDEGEAAL